MSDATVSTPESGLMQPHPMLTSDVVNGVLDGLERAGIDLRTGPSLEKMKRLLVDAARLDRIRPRR